jgi:protease-4
MRDFLKYTLASVLGLMIFMGLSIGGFLGLIILAVSKDTGPQVKDKSMLVFDLSINITDAQRGSSTGQAIQEALSGNETQQTMSLRDVLSAINNAATDSRIVGIYLHDSGGPSPDGTGFATLKEVRQALQKFRASGKKIIAYDMNWEEREYYLGSVANTVILNPFGALELNGLKSEMMFLSNALEKLGIGVQVTRVGKYKSAVEPFILSRSSPENREQMQQLLNDLWREFLTATGKERKKSPQQLQAIADRQGILLAEDARKQGLVDKLAYADAVIADLKKLTDSDENDDKNFRQISLKSYAGIAKDALAGNPHSKNEIAVVYAEGEIVDGQGSVGQVGGDRLARQLRELRQDKDVKAVVLRVNSPGGSATASEVIQREMILLSREAKKPVVVSMGSVAASGGYWISTYSDRIFAEPNTITGSIGVFGILLNAQTLANNNGVTWDIIKTGRYADITTISRPKTAQELEIIQKIVDRIYNQFVTKVAESRKLPKSKVAEIAQGRIWSGIQAQKLGLVDELGGLEVAIRDAAKRANLGNDWRIAEYPEIRSLEERILERLAGRTVLSNPAPKEPLTQEFKKIQQELAILRSLNDPLGAYARLPFNIRIE